MCKKLQKHTAVYAPQALLQQGDVGCFSRMGDGPPIDGAHDNQTHFCSKHPWQHELNMDRDPVWGLIMIDGDVLHLCHL